jgi:hypothetical protein
MRSKVARKVTTALITSAIGGQPGTLMIGLSVMTLSIGTAPVGFGFAAWTQPHEAQEPQAITALASFATRLSFSTKGLPPGMQKVPSLPSGGLPSTARM